MRKLIERIRTKLLIRRVRRDLEWLGYDFGDLTDEEFAERLERAGRIMGRALNDIAVSTEQMGNALRQVGKAYATALEKQ